MSSYKPSDKPQICFSKEINPTAKGDINFYKLVDEVDGVYTNRVINPEFALAKR